MSRIRKKIRQLLWHDFSGSSQTLKLTVIYSLPFIIIFTALIISLVLWETKRHRTEQTEEFLEAARSFYKQILVEKEWIEDSGGFYVRANDGKKSKDGLEGDRFKKIDFASALNGLSQIATEKEGYRFHIARLGVVNTYHSPDIWEQGALTTLRSGADEDYVFSEINGERYFRFMKPLNFKNNIHTNRSQKDTSIGIAITIPTAVSDQIHKAKVQRDVISYSLIGGISLLFIIALIWRFSKKISSVIDREMEENKLKAVVELAGAAAHEMRQPLAVVIGLSDILEEKIKRGENITEVLDMIKDQGYRIDDIIQRMLNITAYKTKDYVDGIRIFDLFNQRNEPGVN
jgi:hypothetical protein